MNKEQELNFSDFFNPESSEYKLIATRYGVPHLKEIAETVRLIITQVGDINHHLFRFMNGATYQGVNLRIASETQEIETTDEEKKEDSLTRMLSLPMSQSTLGNSVGREANEIFNAYKRQQLRILNQNPEYVRAALLRELLNAEFDSIKQKIDGYQQDYYALIEQLALFKSMLEDPLRCQKLQFFDEKQLLSLDTEHKLDSDKCRNIVQYHVLFQDALAVVQLLAKKNQHTLSEPLQDKALTLKNVCDGSYLQDLFLKIKNTINLLDDKYDQQTALGILLEINSHLKLFKVIVNQIGAQSPQFKALEQYRDNILNLLSAFHFSPEIGLQPSNIQKKYIAMMLARSNNTMKSEIRRTFFGKDFQELESKLMAIFSEKTRLDKEHATLGASDSKRISAIENRNKTLEADAAEILQKMRSHHQEEFAVRNESFMNLDKLQKDIHVKLESSSHFMGSDSQRLNKELKYSPQPAIFILDTYRRWFKMVSVEIDELTRIYLELVDMMQVNSESVVDRRQHKQLGNLSVMQTRLDSIFTLRPKSTDPKSGKKIPALMMEVKVDKSACQNLADFFKLEKSFENCFTLAEKLAFLNHIYTQTPVIADRANQLLVEKNFEVKARAACQTDAFILRLPSNPTTYKDRIDFSAPHAQGRELLGDLPSEKRNELAIPILDLADAFFKLVYWDHAIQSIVTQKSWDDNSRAVVEKSYRGLEGQWQNFLTALIETEAAARKLIIILGGGQKESSSIALQQALNFLVDALKNYIEGKLSQKCLRPESSTFGASSSEQLKALVKKWFEKFLADRKAAIEKLDAFLPAQPMRKISMPASSSCSSTSSHSSSIESLQSSPSFPSPSSESALSTTVAEGKVIADLPQTSQSSTASSSISTEPPISEDKTVSKSSGVLSSMESTPVVVITPPLEVVTQQLSENDPVVLDDAPPMDAPPMDAPPFEPPSPPLTDISHSNAPVAGFPAATESPQQLPQSPQPTDLLSAIRAARGVPQKRVDSEVKSPAPKSPTPPTDMFGALSARLEELRNALQGQSTVSSSTSASTATPASSVVSTTSGEQEGDWDTNDLPAPTESPLTTPTLTVFSSSGSTSSSSGSCDSTDSPSPSR